VEAPRLGHLDLDADDEAAVHDGVPIVARELGVRAGVQEARRGLALVGAAELRLDLHEVGPAERAAERVAREGHRVAAVARGRVPVEPVVVELHLRERRQVLGRERAAYRRRGDRPARGGELRVDDRRLRRLEAHRGGEDAKGRLLAVLPTRFDRRHLAVADDRVLVVRHERLRRARIAGRRR
jgi:hypothetical protein